MKIRTILLLSLFLFPFFHYSFSQLNLDYFSDSLLVQNEHFRDAIQVDDGAIVAGYTFNDSANYFPFCARIDTLGNVLWRVDTVTFPTNNFNDLDDFLVMLQGDTLAYRPSFVNDTSEIWLLDANTGQIFWKSNHYFDNIHSIYDYDDSSFVASVSFNGGYFHLARYHKQTGDTLLTVPIGLNSLSNYKRYAPVHADSAGNVYLAVLKRLIRFEGPSHTITMDTIFAISNLDYPLMLDHLPGGNLLLLSNDLARSIDTSTFSVNWTQGIPNHMTADPSDYIIRGDSLYISWAGLHVGGPPEHMLTQKINFRTGQSLWLANTWMHGDGMTWQGSTTFQNITRNRNITLDAESNVYVAGTYGEGRAWGITKLKNSDGAKLWESTVDRTPWSMDGRSNGKWIGGWGNRIMTLGLLQSQKRDETYNEYYHRESFYFAEVNPDSGSVLWGKDLFEHHHFSSYPWKYLPVDPNSSLLLSKRGRATQIQMVDRQNDSIWVYPINVRYENSPRDISYHKGTIWSVTLSGYRPDPPANYLFTHQFDKYGNLISENLWTAQNNNTFAKIFPDSNRAIVIYNSGTQLRLRTDDDGTLSNYSLLQGLYRPEYMEYGNIAIDYSPDEIIFGAEHFGIERLYRIRKSNSQQALIGSFPYLLTIHEVAKDSLNHILICGESTGRREALAKFDRTLNDTLWYHTFDTAAWFSHTALDSSGQNYYLGGISYFGGNDDLTVRKVRASNADSVWKAKFDLAGGLNEVLRDLTIDPYRNNLYLTGYSEDSLSQVQISWILVLDTSGLPLDTIYIPTDSVEYDNEGMIIARNNAGELIGMGKTYHDTYGMAGYITDLDSALHPCVMQTDFTLSDSSICNGESIVLTDQSTNAIQFRWELDDSVISTMPGHTLTLPDGGIYEITLYSGAGSCRDSSSRNITVHQKPVSEIEMLSPNAPCEPDSIHLRSRYSALFYTWRESRVPIPGETQRDYYFKDPGQSGYISLILEGPGGCIDSSFINPLGIRLAPDPGFQANVIGWSPGGFRVDFAPNDPNHASYLWDFGDGTTSSSWGPVHYFPTGGVYNVCLEVVGQNQCETSSCDTSSVPVGISQGSSGKPIMIFPNPGSEQLNFSFPDMQGSCGVILYDSRGQLCIKQDGIMEELFSMKTHHLPAGIYLVEVVDDAGVAERFRWVKY